MPVFLSRRGAATLVRDEFHMPCSVAGLARLASVGGGPPYHRAGGHCLYPRAPLRRWAASRRTPLLTKANEAPVSLHSRP
jgi:hypothetical protein